MANTQVVVLPSTNESILGKGIETRSVVVVNEMCLYQSTGVNSKERGTWFPFLGTNTPDHPDYKIYNPKSKENRRMYEEGSFLKPEILIEEQEKNNSFTSEYKTKMMECFKSKRKAEDLIGRFGSVYGMLISSKLGGGLWETPEGIEFKNFLMQKHTDFYDNFPNFEVAKPGVTKPGELNKWLVDHGGRLRSFPMEIQKYNPAPIAQVQSKQQPQRLITSYDASSKSKQGFFEKIAKKFIGQSPSQPEFEDDTHPKNKL